MLQFGTINQTSSGNVVASSKLLRVTSSRIKTVAELQGFVAASLQRLPRVESPTHIRNTSAHKIAANPEKCDVVQQVEQQVLTDFLEPMQTK